MAKYKIGDLFTPTTEVSNYTNFVPFKIVDILTTQGRRYAVDVYGNFGVFRDTYSDLKIDNWINSSTFKLDLDAMYREELIKEMEEVFNGERKKDTGR